MTAKTPAESLRMPSSPDLNLILTTQGIANTARSGIDASRAALVDVTDDAHPPSSRRCCVPSGESRCPRCGRECPGILTHSGAKSGGWPIIHKVRDRYPCAYVAARVRARSSCSLPGRADRRSWRRTCAVHSSADEDGLEAKDYAADAPENRAPIDYYREMA